MSALITPAELRPIVGDVTLLDVRWALGLSHDDAYEQYVAGHLPGAVYVDLETELADPPHTGTGGRHPLPDAERFGAAMRRAGVSTGRPVIVYDAVAGTSAARAWWLLRYFGHPDVRLLDGGLTGWPGPLDTGAVHVVPGDFVAEPGHLPVLDAAGAAEIAASGVLIDARAAERYRGEVEPVDPAAGHIPGAVNVPTSANVAGGRFRSPAELAVTYDMAARAAGPVGVYCGSGVTAAHDVLALSLLGVDAALYAGSWSDWVSEPDRPVATGTGGG